MAEEWGESRKLESCILLAPCWNLSRSEPWARLNRKYLGGSSEDRAYWELLPKCLGSCAVTLAEREETDKDKNVIHTLPGIYSSMGLKDVPPFLQSPILLLFSLPSSPLLFLFRSVLHQQLYGSQVMQNPADLTLKIQVRHGSMRHGFQNTYLGKEVRGDTHLKCSCLPAQACIGNVSQRWKDQRQILIWSRVNHRKI